MIHAGFLAGLWGHKANPSVSALEEVWVQETDSRAKYCPKQWLIEQEGLVRCLQDGRASLAASGPQTSTHLHPRCSGQPSTTDPQTPAPTQPHLPARRPSITSQFLHSACWVTSMINPRPNHIQQGVSLPWQTSASEIVPLIKTTPANEAQDYGLL